MKFKELSIGIAKYPVKKDEYQNTVLMTKTISYKNIMPAIRPIRIIRNPQIDNFNKASYKIVKH